MAFLKRFCVSIIILFLCLSVATAQTEEEEDFDAAQYRSAPEVQSYAALCRAIYWKHTAHRTADDRERRGNYQEARGQLIAAIRSDPRSSFLYARLAEVFVYLGDDVRAKSACNKALELNPGNADAHYWSGRLKYRRDRKGAIHEFKEAAKLNPDHIAAQSFLAALSYDTEDFQTAAGAYSAIVKFRPYEPKLRNQLGISYMKIGETAKAIKEFNAAVRLDSGDVDSHFRLARLYARQSRNEEAIEECLTVLGRSSGPGIESTILLLGEIYVATGDFDKAISRLTGFLRRQRMDKDILAEAHYRLATAYKGKNETNLADPHFQKSIDIYEEIMVEDQKSNDSRYYLAMVYDARGDTSQAEKYLREYIRLEPDEPNAYNYLGYMLVQNGVKLEEALGLIKKAVAKEPENGAFHDSLGWAYFKLGNLDEAVVELERAIELIPDDSEVREHLGEVYFEKGGDFTQKAIVQWEKALEIRPNNATLQQRLEELSKSLE